MDSSSSTSTEIREMLSPDEASADEERSMVQAAAPVWASIGDGNPRQTICGEEVDFLAYPDWFLSSNKGLAKVPWVKGSVETMPCGPDRAEVMRNARPVVDWHRQNLDEKVQQGHLDQTNDTVREFWS